MKFGVCSWAFTGILQGRRPVEELTTLAEELGYAALEGAFAPDRGVGELDAGAGPPRRGVPVSSLATLQLHRFHLTDRRAPRRDAARDVLEKMLDRAARWSIRTLSFSPGPLPDDGCSEAEVAARVAEELRPFLARARALGVGVYLENLPRSAIETRRGMARFLAALGDDVGVCLDVGNTVVDPPVSAWLDELGDRIGKVHLSDGAMVDGAFAARLPLQGGLDWTGLAAALERLPGAPECFVEAPLPAGHDERAFLRALFSATQEALCQ